MLPLYHDPHFTFRFADNRLIPRFHLDGVEAGRRVDVFRIDPHTGERLGLLATAAVGEGGWVDLPEPIMVRAGEAFIAVPEQEADRADLGTSRLRRAEEQEEGDMAKGSLNPGLYDPRRGDPAIRTQRLGLGRKPFEPARTNCFSVYLIESGAGTFWADASHFSFGPASLLFFVPYQHVRFVPDAPVHAEVIQFHANFLCVETFHAEVGCSGALFNDPYGAPVVTLDERAKSEVTGLFERIRAEQAGRDLAYGEAMLAHLKVLLILATRLKSPRVACGPGADLRHPLLAELRDMIEQNYRTLHSPADYAKLLHVTAKTLGRVIREHLGTTLTDLIRSRILTHAKWQLLHTLKPVKEVARELGFGDELYFSRLFKKATGHSPTFFREFETAIRGGSNLSMSSGHAPILRTASSDDT